MGEGLDEVINSRETPLFTVCENGNERLVKYFIEELGASVNKTNKYGETSLFKACESGNLNLVKYLVELGTNIHKSNDHNEIPLFFACSSGNLSLVKYLVEKLETDITKENYKEETVIFNACYSGNINLIRYLIDRGLNLNKQNKEWETPLMRSYGDFGRYKKIIKSLIDYVDIEYRNNKKEDPIISCLSLWRFKFCKIFSRTWSRY